MWQKIAIFWLTLWLKHRITRKLLKTDRYMLRGVWQALNCLSIHATYCVIVAGASPGETKMWAAVRVNWYTLFYLLIYSCKLHNFITVVNYTIFAAIIDSFMSNQPSLAWTCCVHILTKSSAIRQQLYKPASSGLSAIAASSGLSAIAELFVHD